MGVLIKIGNRDSHRDEQANVKAVVMAETERTKMLQAIHEGDADRAAEHDRRAEAAVNECYERAMERAANLERSGDPRGELARANRQMIEHQQRRGDGRYSR